MCTIMKKTKELLKVYERHQDPRKSGNLEKKKKKTVVPLKLQGRLCGISDQKSPCFSIVNKLLFQIRMKYSQKHICL